MSRETVDQIAERIERAADRYRNARDFEQENESRIAAQAIRASSDINQARELARVFEAGQWPPVSHGDAALRDVAQRLAGSSPRRPWWKRWRWGQTDDS